MPSLMPVLTRQQQSALDEVYDLANELIDLSDILTAEGVDHLVSAIALQIERIALELGARRARRRETR